ncbi:ABC transporter substrate-binding protein [Desulfoscipio geothermicus]|uniref:Putative ABC transport system substrate-binding protein n=1 Tax=Desulfoscipio geothermicus DSM 3669 TaxID=1121426 RepID=A0A1I6CPN3_9FIRM|nr:ABC transporter substrate-binding protein [Desulfoscipio geothermicus]SFQ95113.1 putative ABC transport system substrate-binding protein [Desulfoscipio geothermicus DSM 3669]
MKRILLGLMILGLFVTLTGCGGGGKSESSEQQGDKQVQLGIIQIAEHPALDAARQGFLDTLAKNGYEDGKNLVVDYQNAQGDQPTLQSIANKFAQDKKDLVLAIATPSAMAMANETKEIPILITAVTDPVAAKLVNSLEKPGTNVTGTTDMNPVEKQLELIKDFVPDVKNVGIIYNSSEINSDVQVKIAREAAPKLGIELQEATVTASSEVMQAAQSLVGKVDAIYLPTDNMVISSLAAVLQVAEENKIPVIAGESNSVEQGALATIGLDYYKLGSQTAEIALRVLNGEKPQDIAVESQKDSNIVINLQAAERMGVTVSDEVKTKAVRVIE